jgi:DNA mismatch repair protein MutS
MTATAAARTASDFIADGHTPMMAQYHAVKARYPDCMVFYRMGDFFELFFDDAVNAAEVLDITLTKRGKTAGEEIPMAGVPAHSFEPYLARLIKAGFKVAICDQTETPEQAKKRAKENKGQPALVNRDVVRIVTQGTLTEDTLLDARENNYIAAVAEIAGQFGLAWLELSTGEFMVQGAAARQLGAAIARIGASEIVIPDRFRERTDLYHHLAAAQDKLSTLPAALFDAKNAQKRLETLFGVGTLSAFGAFSRAEIAAAGTLIDYVERTQVGKLPYIAAPKQVSSGTVMDIDPATRRSLELTRTLSGEKRGSLLSCIDRTVTGAGARVLHSRLCAPLTDIAGITQRHDEVASLHADTRLREDIRAILSATPDMERAVARLTVGRGGPRDLAVIRDGLKQAELMRATLAQRGPDALGTISAALAQQPSTQAIADRLRAALHDEPPALARDGGFIREGYSPELDKYRVLQGESKRLIAALETKYKNHTGIDALKITYNNVLGFFIEVPAKKADPMMVRGGDTGDNPYIHRQTMANAVRFTTAELAELERDMAQASDRAVAIELELFAQMAAEITRLSGDIGGHARALAAIDVAAALAELAVRENYVRPHMDTTRAFAITGGRHPVVEQALRKNGADAFVPNDCDLSDAHRLWLLTGPNMAGKSTFLRQNALIAIMAHMGGFVPAAAAHIGIVDKIFSRVGASDDLASGRSTFMVEMVETAAILNQATDKSLVILDEIGRGTATFDGLSIAWACVEALHETTRCRTIFATHYHELTGLTARLPSLSCHTMAVKEWQGDIIFLHAVADGTADRSYGIHVAKLAGLPPAVIDRTGEVLAMLEQGKQSGVLAKLADDLPLFRAAPPPAPAKPSPLDDALAALNPDSLSPREALDALYSLKAMSRN